MKLGIVNSCRFLMSLISSVCIVRCLNQWEQSISTSPNQWDWRTLPRKWRKWRRSGRRWTRTRTGVWAREISGILIGPELLQYCVLIGRELQSVGIFSQYSYTSNLCHKEPAKDTQSLKLRDEMLSSRIISCLPLVLYGIRRDSFHIIDSVRARKTLENILTLRGSRPMRMLEISRARASTAWLWTVSTGGSLTSSSGNTTRTETRISPRRSSPRWWSLGRSQRRKRKDAERNRNPKHRTLEHG